MFWKNLKRPVIAAVATIVGFAGFGSAANAAVTGPMTSGGTYAGWKVSFAPGIQLYRDPAIKGFTLRIEKFAEFFSADEGLVIAFQQVSPTAEKNIQILDEVITNSTGKSWSSFELSLSPITQQSPLLAKFTQGFADNDVSPFTKVDVSDTSVLMHDGSFASGETHFFGFGPSLVNIQTNAVREGTSSFILKELPTSGVPIPAAAWTGLSGLAGMGVIAFGRKAKKLFV